MSGKTYKIHCKWKLLYKKKKKKITDWIWLKTQDVDEFLYNLSYNFSNGISWTQEMLPFILCGSKTPFWTREN